MAQLKASQTKLELESNLLTKTENKTADGITYTLGLDTSKLPKTDIVAGKGVSVSKTDPMKPIVLLNDDQDFSGTVTASEFKVGSSASLDTTGLNLIGTSMVTLKDSNPSPEKRQYCRQRAFPFLVQRHLLEHTSKRMACTSSPM